MKNKNKPTYKQAKDDILDLIISNKYKIGDLIPSVREMAKSLNYTKICIQNAVKLLAVEGVLENLPRKGCHLKSLPPQELKLNGLLDDNKMVQPHPIIPGAKKIRVGVYTEMTSLGNLWKELFLRYMTRHPGIHIELVDISNLSQYQISNEIDILHIPAEKLEWFASRDLLFDLEKNNEKLNINQQDFFPGYINACYHDDKLWGMPSSAGGNCLFYNSNYSDLIQPLAKDMQSAKYLETCKKISKKMPAKMALTANLPASFILGLLAEGKNLNPEEVILKGNLKKQREIMQDFAPYLFDRQIFYTSPVMDNHQESHIQDFLSRRTMVMQGSTAWLYLDELDHQSSFSWGILPAPPHPAGNGALFMHVISNLTLFPMECIEVLNYLGSKEVQSFFAENGRIVAHRQAIKNLNMPEIDDKSLNRLIKGMDNTDVFKTSDPYYHEYIHLVFLEELLLWQKKIYNTEEFLDNLRKKTHYYYRAKRIQDERMPSNIP